MVKSQHLNTRVSPEAYQALLRKCAEGGCTPYEYVRRLIHSDMGLDVNGDVPEDLGEVQEPVQKELSVKNERDYEDRVKIIG